MVRTFGKQRLVALVAAAGIVSVWMHPLMAEGRRRAGPDEAGSGPMWSVQLLDGYGKVVAIPTTVEGVAKQPSNLPTHAELEKLRHELTGIKFGLDQKAAARAERALKLLEVAMAPNAEERHARVLRLGVTIFEQPSNDGREGTIKTFVAGGKPRIRVFLPASRIAVSPVDQSNDPTGGPFAAADQTGRWKSDGNGGCYWDANDEGPDQCSSDGGRWKSDGNGGCYWLDNDDGPNQCEPAVGGGTGGYTCYYEDSPSPCATQQEYEDFLATIAQAEADLDQLNADIAALDAQMEAYCASNPWECANPSEIVSGPSVPTSAQPCWAYAGAAVVGAATFGARLFTSVGLAGGSAAALTVSGIGAATLGLYAAAGGAALALGAYAYCAYAVEPLAIVAESQPAIFNRQQFAC